MTLRRFQGRKHMERSAQPAAQRPRSAVSSKSFTATVSVRGEEFSFRLYHRPLALGTTLTVQYYWMDSSQFRSLNSEAAAANFRNCVGHADALLRAGKCDELERQIQDVTALCFCLTSRSKAVQRIYRDAHLDPKARSYLPEELPDTILSRIRDVVAGRDDAAVRRELDRALGRFEPPAWVRPALQKAYERWVGRGVQLLRRDGLDGLDMFLQELKYRLSLYRKQRGDVWIRHFINLFCYEAKVRFYTCYSHAWISLIPWLKQHHGLDPASERFLRFWHYQPRGVEVPSGRTAGGLYLPTHGRATHLEPGRGETSKRRSLLWTTDSAGPTYIPDVFRGQVLSLHPLSGIFMKDQALCALAGQYFEVDRPSLTDGRGWALHGPEYWRLVGAILAAAYSYRIAWNRQNEQRGVHRRNSNLAEATSALPLGFIEADQLEAFAAARQARCPDCGGKLHYLAFHPGDSNDEQFHADYECASCLKLVPVSAPRSELERWLLDHTD
jgi:hypothetical protein